MEEPPRSPSIVAAAPAVQPALVKNPSTDSLRKPGRRVSFDLPSHNRSSSALSVSDIDSNIDHLEKGRYHPHYFAFCVWTFIAFAIIFVVLLFMVISYLAFLQAGMPYVNVRSLNVNKLQVDNNTQNMDSEINLGLRISNRNEKLKLLYGTLTVDVSSKYVLLGKARVDGFSQKPQNETNFEMTMAQHNVKVDMYAVEEIQDDMKAREMVFDVYVSGKIGFEVRSLHVITVPFLSSCRQMKKKDVDFGRRPRCEVKMFAFRPSKN